MTIADVRRDIVAVGASAGGVEALRLLVGELPSDLPAAVFVVLHVAATGRSILPSILTRAGGPPAEHAEDGMEFEYGRIYVAPPDRHLTLNARTVSLGGGPKEHGHRPAVDALFRSAALNHGPRVIGVVLSGTLDDGSIGLRTIKDRGGLALVQDPEEALYQSMPRAAIASTHPHAILRLAALARTIADVAGSHVEKEDALVAIDERTDGDRFPFEEDAQDGRRSAFACPDCGGALWEVEDGGVLRFACRVGHAFSEASMLEQQGKALEAALWTGLRVLEERAALSRRLSSRLAARGSSATANSFAHQAREAEEHAVQLREFLERLGATSAPDPFPDMEAAQKTG